MVTAGTTTPSTTTPARRPSAGTVARPRGTTGARNPGAGPGPHGAADPGLTGHEDRGQRHQEERQDCRPGRVEARPVGPVDHPREDLVAHQGHGPEVAQDVERHQQGAGRNAGADLRDRDPAGDLPAPHAQRGGDLLLGRVDAPQGSDRGQEHVREGRHREDQHRTGEAGQPGRDVEPDEGADVARDRQREHHRDRPEPRAGQVRARDQPRAGTPISTARRVTVPASATLRSVRATRRGGRQDLEQRGHRAGPGDQVPDRQDRHDRGHDRGQHEPPRRTPAAGAPAASGRPGRTDVPVPGPTGFAGPGTGSLTVGATVTGLLPRPPGGAGTRPTGSAARPRPAGPGSRRWSPGRTGRWRAGRGTPATAGPRAAAPSINGYSESARRRSPGPSPRSGSPRGPGPAPAGRWRPGSRRRPR